MFSFNKIKHSTLDKLVACTCFAVLAMALLGGCTKADPKDQTPQVALEGNLLVSAAASLQAPLEEAYVLFQAKEPKVTIDFNYGGSGALLEQITNGAPADVFISANKKFMNTATEKGLMAQNTIFDWLNNTMAVITPADSSLKLETIADVSKATKVALGTIESVPAGEYAKGALEKAGIWQELAPRVVYGKDVKQVAVYVESGSADVGFVYSTDTVGRDQIKTAFILPADLVAPIVYPAGIIKASASPEIAATFLAFLKTPEVAQIFTGYGFTIAQ